MRETGKNRLFICISFVLFLSVIQAMIDPSTDGWAKKTWLMKGSHMLAERDMIPEQTWYDVQSYSINVEVFPGNETVDGQVTAVVRIVEPNITEIVLDAADHLTIDAIAAPGYSYHTHQNHRLHVFFADPIPADDERSIQITYHGDTNSGYIWSGGIVYSGSYFWSLGCPYGLHKWVPCKDHPSDKANWLDLQITVPTQYVVASNGVREGITDNGDGTRTHHWHENYPIATYLFCINAYPYNEVMAQYEYAPGQFMPIYYYVPSTVPTGFQYVETAIPIFADVFGEYPFVTEKFAIAKVTANFGAMEHQNCVTTSVTSGMTMVHELAHQWFGDKVTCTTWQHGWLNEGFATYLEAIYVENTQDFAAYQNYMNGMEWNWNDSRTVFVTDTSDFSQIFDSIIYDKGAWVNHMLRRVVGDDNYFEAIRDYLTIFAYQNVTTEDLQAVVESHYGSGLDWFFQEWIYWNGHPEYNFQWAATMDTCYLVIEQSNSGDGPGLFSMPVDFGVELAGGNEILETIWVEGDITSARIPIPATAENVVCDPNNWLLNSATGSGTNQFELGDPQYTLDDEGQNGFLEAGESGTLDIQLTNWGIPTGEIDGLLTCDHPHIIITQPGSSFFPVGLGQPTMTQTPFELELTTGFDTQVVPFYLILTWDAYTDTVTFTLPLGSPNTLLANASMDPGYGQLYLDLLADAQWVIHYWDTGMAMTLQELLPLYPNVIYFTGDNEFDPIPDFLHDALQDYRESGGNLLVMGRSIGNAVGDTPFYQSVLQAAYLGEHEGYIIYGDDDHPLIQGRNLIINHPEDCDRLTPQGSAVEAYAYSGNHNSAGIIAESPGKLLYMGFDPLNIISTGGFADSPGEFLMMVRDWFQVSSLPGDPNGDEVIDVLDIILMVNFIMGSVEPTGQQQQAADLNQDGVIDVLDIIAVVNLIMAGD